MRVFSFSRWLCVLAPVVAVAAAVPVSGFAQTPATETRADDPTDGSKDVDRVVPFASDRVLEAAKQAMAIYGCEIKKERADALECTRSRNVGVFVGSGGEKVTTKLESKDGGTRVVIKTGKGFVGRLGKKNWSTPIFVEIERLLRQS